MKGVIHIYSSALLGGAVYKLSQSLEISVITFLCGFLIDIDHVFDYLILAKKDFSIKNLLSWCYNNEWEIIFLFFHSYELYFLLGIITYYFPNGILIGLMLGTGVHLILDQIWNCHLRSEFRVSPWFYFLTYRVYYGFRKDKLCNENNGVIKSFSFGEER